MKAHRKDNKHKIRPIMRKDAIYMIRWSMENCFTCKCLRESKKKKQLSHRICVYFAGIKCEISHRLQTLNWFLLERKYADWMIKASAVTLPIAMKPRNMPMLFLRHFREKSEEMQMFVKFTDSPKSRGGKNLGVGAVKIMWPLLWNHHWENQEKENYGIHLWVSISESNAD